MQTTTDQDRAIEQLAIDRAADHVAVAAAVPLGTAAVIATPFIDGEPGPAVRILPDGELTDAEHWTPEPIEHVHQPGLEPLEVLVEIQARAAAALATLQEADAAGERRIYGQSALSRIEVLARDAIAKGVPDLAERATLVQDAHAAVEQAQ